MSEDVHFRGVDGRYSSFEVEIKRLDQLRQAGDLAVAAALAAAEKAVNAALVASEKAIDKAEAAQLRVNETQNEFRGTLKDQAATLMPRAEAELLIDELRKATADLKSRLDVGPPSILALQKQADEGVGRRIGSIESRTLVFGVIGALVAVGLLAVALITAIGKLP